MKIRSQLTWLLLWVLFSDMACALEPAPPVPPLPPPPDADEGTTTTAPTPEVTIVQRGEDRLEEYRVGGRLYLIKVTPKTGRPYYLVDTTGRGTFVRRNSVDPALFVPMWVLFQW